MRKLKEFISELGELFAKYKTEIDEALSLIPPTTTGEIIKTVAEGAEDAIVSAESATTGVANATDEGAQDAAEVNTNAKD